MENGPQYKKILADEFESRRLKNSAYSLRAFARDLGLSPASLSLILNHKQGLSLKKAKAIAAKLGLSATEEVYFCTSVASSHAKAFVKRREAQEKLESSDLKLAELSLEYFKIISDWEHFAVLELSKLAGFKSDEAWIARRLNISQSTVKEVINRLIKLELLEDVNGKLIKTEGYLATPSGTPNRSLKKYHTQILDKAQTALETQSVKEREFASVVFAMNEADLEWAKTEMTKFRRALVQRLVESSEKNRLYQFSMQMFALDQIENAKEGSIK